MGARSDKSKSFMRESDFIGMSIKSISFTSS